jgi:hypothetical protein
MTSGSAYSGAHLIKGQTLGAPIVSQPTAEGEQVGGRRVDRGRGNINICHSFTIAKESQIFPSVLH